MAVEGRMCRKDKVPTPKGCRARGADDTGSLVRLRGNLRGGRRLEQLLSGKQTCQTQDVGARRVLIPGSGNRITHVKWQEGAGTSAGMNSLLCKFLLRLKHGMKSLLQENHVYT